MPNMSGHNKWSTIKHKKAKTDAQKGKIFSKFAREITMAVKIGGNHGNNARLSLAIQKAKSSNMPNENIKRAIEKGEGPTNTEQFEEILMEGYGPNGVAILIETLTDNRNRTVGNVRTALSKAGGSLAQKGAVSYLFKPCGIFLFESASEDDILNTAIEFDVDEIDTKDDGTIEVTCKFEDFFALKTAFETAGLPPTEADTTMLPSTSVELTDDQSQAILALIDKLEDDDDVQNVYTNLLF